MAAKVVTSFLPDLVLAISDCVQPVSDQCLAKGLIPEPVYKRILESGGTSEDKARTLILAVKKSIERDIRCFELLVKILEENFPFGSDDSLLIKIKKEYESGNTCRDVVSTSPNKQILPGSEFSGQITLQQMPLFVELEESIRQHTEAYTEKRLLEEQLKSKSEESEKLKEELRDLKSKTQEETDLSSVASQRISACEAEMTKLKERIEALESTIEYQGMGVKRGRSVMEIKMNEFIQAVQKEKNAFRSKLEKNKDEFEAKLREKDKELIAIQRKYDKATDELKVKDLEHKVALQGKDLEIKNLELEQERSKGAVKPSNLSPSPTPSDDPFVDYDDDEQLEGDDHFDLDDF